MRIIAIGETVDVHSGWGRYAYEVTREYSRQNIEFFFVSSSELLKTNSSNFLKNVFKLRKIIKDYDPDIIHAFDVWPFAVYAVLANIFINKPLFITGVGTYSIPPIKGLKSILMRYSFRKAKAVFCISRYTEDLIRKSEPKVRSTVVNWGTSELPNINNDEIKQFQKKIGLINGNPVVITVGQIKHRKGQLNTLRSLKILKKKYPDILYIIIGNADDTAYVQKIRDFAQSNDLSKNFKIIDNQKTDRELSYLYNLADVFVMTSNNDGLHFEGFGLVFLEAAQFGIPAVGSSGCGIEDAIVDGKTGKLSKQGDEQDIAEKLTKVLENKEEMGLRAMERAREFTWERTVASYLKVYKKYV